MNVNKRPITERQPIQPLFAAGVVLLLALVGSVFISLTPLAKADVVPTQPIPAHMR